MLQIKRKYWKRFRATYFISCIVTYFRFSIFMAIQNAFVKKADAYTWNNQ